MDEDFSATVVFDSPFGLITTTCKKLLQFNQDDVTHHSELPKKTVSWDSKLVPEEQEKKKVKKSVILPPPKPLPAHSTTKNVQKLPAITSLFMTSKKNRTKVFSGNSQIRVPTREVPTLLALCIRCIDAKKQQIFGFGLLSIDMITTVLRRANINQLLDIESKDPSLIEEKKTEELWKIHYKKDFKIVPESSSKTSWRSLYMDAKKNKLDESKKKMVKITSSVTSKSDSTSIHTTRKHSGIILLENDMFSEALNQSESSKRKRSNDVQKKKKKKND